MTSCPTGKRVFDKRTAVTMRNATLKYQHIIMEIYHCYRCNGWHLASIGKHKPFRKGDKHKRIFNRLTSE
jgi:hypothetical protein